VTVELPRCPASATAAQVAAALDEAGAVIIERLIDADTCDRLAAELAPWLADTPVGADDFSGVATRRTGKLLSRCPTSIDLVAHPLILDIADAVLWPNKTTFQLHLTQAIAIGPGSAAQMLHRDHWCFDFFPFPADVNVELSTIWALTDFTEERGATRVVPGTHRWHNDNVRSLRHEDSVGAAMPRGSVVLYLGSTVHAGGANTTTDHTRIGINVDYVLGWLRQEENQYLSYSLDEVAAMPERVQRLIGYEPGAYALGYIEGGVSPMTLLGGTRMPATQAFDPR
jgi:ectoine hydroxylase-related dioxygenase (phytanoyl-CoA dioxygenase family)